MVTVIRRMRKLRTINDSQLTSAQLLALKLGPGAAVFPPEVTRLHLEFAVKQENGHTGARYLPYCETYIQSH
ncbi:hypothetical protein D0Z07_8212 [Hyphodiscus hymeniophilus]|uniref:Uncharacterized protein n=1 Tax=Hyphodiscus hymeniophilus TaxID=353542 RepID=A0A9P6SLD8_9HELO|nr:hypothetical protein D0Z07_8212 [Hyphodiscus hymeniophilus]